MVNLWLIIGITLYLVGGDWNHGILNDFPILGMEHHPNKIEQTYFSEGLVETTNQL